MSNRKPHSNLPGYVAELKIGNDRHVILFDRQDMTDTAIAELDIEPTEPATRWIVAIYPQKVATGIKSQRKARDLMKAIRREESEQNKLYRARKSHLMSTDIGLRSRADKIDLRATVPLKPFASVERIFGLR